MTKNPCTPMVLLKDRHSPAGGLSNRFEREGMPGCRINLNPSAASLLMPDETYTKNFPALNIVHEHRSTGITNQQNKQAKLNDIRTANEASRLVRFCTVQGGTAYCTPRTTDLAAPRSQKTRARARVHTKRHDGRKEIVADSRSLGEWIPEMVSCAAHTHTHTHSLDLRYATVCYATACYATVSAVDGMVRIR